jgi:hypothetical protein
VVCDAIQQGRGHFGVAKNRHPFGKRQIRRDDQRGLFVELTDQVEQQRAAGGWERQISQFIEDHGVGLHQLPGHIPGLALLFLPLQLVDQIDGVKEAHAFALMDGGHAESRRQVRLPGARRTRGILPNITAPMGGSFIGIILATVSAWRS